ncbi:MAG: hypothetical protein NW703_14825 [Nitrospiraceae bacterium]
MSAAFAIMLVSMIFGWAVVLRAAYLDDRPALLHLPVEKEIR